MVCMTVYPCNLGSFASKSGIYFIFHDWQRSLSACLKPCCLIRSVLFVSESEFLFHSRYRRFFQIRAVFWQISFVSWPPLRHLVVLPSCASCSTSLHALPSCVLAYHFVFHALPVYFIILQAVLHALPSSLHALPLPSWGYFFYPKYFLLHTQHCVKSYFDCVFENVFVSCT